MEKSDLDKEYISKAEEAFRSKDMEGGFAIFLEGAKMGSTECAFMFAEAMSMGERWDLAYQYYLQAALDGHEQSQFNLASLYLAGKGVEEDIVKAYFWFGTAAKAGHADAIKICNKLGFDFNKHDYGLTTGNLIYHGYQKAQLRSEPRQSIDEYTFSELSESELSDRAKNALRGNEYALARNILGYGIEAGYISCANDLGFLCYIVGKYSVALDLFLEAAMAGEPQSQYMLSVLYKEGKGIPSDMEKSTFWLGSAAKSGNESAIESCRETGLNYLDNKFGLTRANLIQHGYIE